MSYNIYVIQINKGKPMLDYDRLDAISASVREGDHRSVGVLSTGEQVYVGLAASNAEILNDAGFSIVGAINRLDTDELNQLIQRWRYR